MRTFSPGDKITPNFFGAWSCDTNARVRQGRIVTVEREVCGLITIREESGDFFSYDFQLAPSFGEHHTALPQAHAISWNKGDKVTPKKGAAKSMDGAVTITPKQVVTIREVKGEFLLMDDGCFGIFSALDFKLVHSEGETPVQPPPQSILAIVSTPSTKLSQKQPALPPTAQMSGRNHTLQQREPISRKAVKRKFETTTGRTLEWRDGDLCFAGTENKVPNSPHLPSDKSPKKPKEAWE